LESNWSPKWTPAEFRGRHSSTSGTREFQTRILRGFLFLQKPNKSAQKPGKPSSVSSSSDSLCSGEAAGLLTMAERPPLASGGEAHRDAGSRAAGPWAENPPTHFGRADCPDHCQHRRLWAQQSDPGRHQRRHHRRSRPRPRCAEGRESFWLVCFELASYTIRRSSGTRHESCSRGPIIRSSMSLADSPKERIS